MKFRRNLLTVALTAALGFGVWTAAVTFADFVFKDGDTLSASEFNDLLNSNFAEVEAAINTIESRLSDAEARLGSLDAAVSSAETAISDLDSSKLDKDGGTNSVGSGPPLAFGFVNASGKKLSGTDNFTVEQGSETGTYLITIDDVEYKEEGFATLVQGKGYNSKRLVSRPDATSDGELLVEIYSVKSDGGLEPAYGPFYFVTYRDGN